MKGSEMAQGTSAAGRSRQSSAGAAGAAQGAAGAAATTSETADVLKSLLSRTNQDVGADEYISAVLANAAGTNLLNSKLQVDNAMEECQSSIKSAQSHLDELRTVRLQMLSNMTTNSQNTQAVVTDSLKLGSDRMWNINETDAIAATVISTLSNLGIKSDAGAAAVLEALGRILREQNKPA
jgi:hypothetical protein